MTIKESVCLREGLEEALDKRTQALRGAIQAFRMEAAAGYDTQQLVQAADHLNGQAVALHAACVEEINAKIPND